jgi:hypothetical protein
MNVEQIIAEIEWLEHLLELSDARPSRSADLEEERHNGCETCIDNPWVQLPTPEWLEHLSKQPDNRLLQVTGFELGKARDEKDDNVTYFTWAWFLRRKRSDN